MRENGERSTGRGVGRRGRGRKGIVDIRRRAKSQRLLLMEKEVGRARKGTGVEGRTEKSRSGGKHVLRPVEGVRRKTEGVGREKIGVVGSHLGIGSMISGRGRRSGSAFQIKGKVRRFLWTRREARAESGRKAGSATRAKSGIRIEEGKSIRWVTSRLVQAYTVQCVTALRR
jgi:hypothetical protein